MGRDPDYHSHGLDHAILAWGTHARRPARAIAELGEAVRTMLATGA